MLVASRGGWTTGDVLGSYKLDCRRSKIYSVIPKLSFKVRT